VFNSDIYKYFLKSSTLFYLGDYFIVMATAGPRSIGSIETWEPPDKSFSKHILKEGKDGPAPSDGSVCTVLLCQVGQYS
jgi:hypothetical protein